VADGWERGLSSARQRSERVFLNVVAVTRDTLSILTHCQVRSPVCGSEQELTRIVKTVCARRVPLVVDSKINRHDSLIVLISGNQNSLVAT